MSTTVQICIELDFSTYDADGLKEILKTEFSDEFKFEIIDVAERCIACDYAISSFENDFDARSALKRINTFLEYAEFDRIIRKCPECGYELDESNTTADIEDNMSEERKFKALMKAHLEANECIERMY